MDQSIVGFDVHYRDFLKRELFAQNLMLTTKDVVKYNELQRIL
jgi:hypothetical protein